MSKALRYFLSIHFIARKVLFACMYRAIVFEARNALQFISSVENLILLPGAILLIPNFRMTKAKK